MSTSFVYLLLSLVVAFVLAVLLIPYPIIEGLSRIEIQDAYNQMIIWCDVLGVLVGVGGAGAARRRVRHRPGETASRFHDRVAEFGLKTMGVALVAGIILASVLAYLAPLYPYAPLERVALLLPELRFLVVIIGTAMGAGAAFFAGSLVSRWSGQFSLVPRRAA